MHSLILLTVGLFAAQEPSVADAIAFFEKYAAAEQNFDPTLADLYHDQARIRTLRDDERSLELGGAQWKELLRSIMSAARERGDTNAYSDVEAAARTTALGEGFRISATRYSDLKCYEDTGFYIDVVPRGESWLIVEQYSASVALSRCEPDPELARALAHARHLIKPHLPIDLDEETRLIEVDVVGSALVYWQRLHATVAAELDVEATRNALTQIALQSACNDQMRPLLDAGATLRFVTLDREDEQLADVVVPPGLCTEP